MRIKDIKTLGGRLKYIRDELSLSQMDLAKIAGTTQQAIQQAECGKARTPRYLAKLAKKIGVPHEWLALNVLSTQSLNATNLSARDGDILNSFKSMNKKDQDLMLELMKSRKKKSKK